MRGRPLAISVLVALIALALLMNEDPGVEETTPVTRPDPEGDPELIMRPQRAGRSDARTAKGPKAQMPSTNAEEAEDTWHIDFELVGAPTWTLAEFVPTNGPSMRMTNRPDAPSPRGSLAVRGSGRLVIHAPQRVVWISDQLKRPPSDSLQLTFALREGLAVAGMVVGSDGVTPVANGSVRAWQPHVIIEWGRGARKADRVRTDVNGRFRVAGLSPGDVKLRVRASDPALGGKTLATTAAGNEDVVVRLTTQGVAHLVVTNASTGAKVEKVTCEWADGAVGVERQRGVITVQGLPVGEPGVLYVNARGYVTAEVPYDFPAQGGELRREVALTPDRTKPATMAITLRSSGVETMWGVPVTQRLANGARRTTTASVNDGRLYIRLHPKTRAVVIGSMGWDSGPGPVEVTIDAEEIRPGARLERTVTLVSKGFVYFPSEPPGRTAHFTQGGERIDRTIALVDQTWWMAALPPGAWSYRIEGEHEMWSGTVEIRAQESAKAEPLIERKSDAAK